MQEGDAPRPISAAGEAALRRFEEAQEQSNTTPEEKESDPVTTDISTPESNPHISLKVVGQDGNEIFFKIKKKTALSKLFGAWCGRQAVSQSSVRFLYDGRRITPDQTPELLGMEEDDIIDVALQQTGGQYLLYM